MLVDDPRVQSYNPILEIIAIVNGNDPETARIAQGIYRVGSFSGMDTESYEGNYPRFPDADGNEYRCCYGVCDSVQQVLDLFPELETSKRKFVLTVTPVLRDNQPSSGGWRWHKWGPYIGTHESTAEYLYDEPEISGVLVYHIYEIL